MEFFFGWAHQAAGGELYSRIAQSFASLTGRTSGLPQMSVTEGRQRTVRRLQRAVSAFLNHFQQPEIQDQAKKDLIAAITDNDDYGLLR